MELVPEFLPGMYEALGSIPSTENNAKIKLFLAFESILNVMYLFIYYHECVCMGLQGQRAYGSERSVVELVPSAFLWVLGIELRLPGLHSNCLYLLSHLTCAEMLLLIRGLIVIFKTNDVLMV